MPDTPTPDAERESRVLAAVTTGLGSHTEISERSGVSPALTAAHLMILEMRGLVWRAPGGRFALRVKGEHRDET